MKIKLLSLIIVSFLILCVFSSCGCKHEWKNADCITPRTCALCNETEGEENGHKWLDATCTAPKTCKNCDESEGDPLGHDWLEATTENPITCSRCSVTEGKKIETDPRFTTESTKEFYGKWTCDVVLTGEMIGMEGYIDELPCTLSYDFKNDGALIADIEIHDHDIFIDAVKKMTRETLAYSMMAQGIPENQLDDAMISSFGMTLDEYVEVYIEQMDLDDIFGAFTQDLVYYVGQNGIYASDSWLGEFECSEYTIDKDTLIIDNDTLEEDGEPLEWKKAD